MTAPEWEDTFPAPPAAFAGISGDSDESPGERETARSVAGCQANTFPARIPAALVASPWAGVGACAETESQRCLWTIGNENNYHVLHA